MSDITNRMGKFSIDFRLIKEEPEKVLLMLSGKLVVRAEARLEMAQVEYHAYCDDFEEIEPGQLIPEYVPEYVAEFSEQAISEDNADRTLIRVSAGWHWVRKCGR